ncbi:MAG: hypothetical protein MSA77_03765 [Selenomonadales bacterium]|nr:hypothetical protein [Selenomonadales bacterium]
MLAFICTCTMIMNSESAYARDIYAGEFDGKSVYVVQEKKMRPLMVVCMSLSVLCAIISGGISIIVAILCFLQRYDKSIVIQHKHGTVKITDCTGTSAEITEFFDYVRKYNPDSIRINM